MHPSLRERSILFDELDHSACACDPPALISPSVSLDRQVGPAHELILRKV